jgi:hypothetical protein
MSPNPSRDPCLATIDDRPLAKMTVPDMNKAAAGWFRRHPARVDTRA